MHTNRNQSTFFINSNNIHINHCSKYKQRTLHAQKKSTKEEQREKNMFAVGSLVSDKTSILINTFGRNEMKSISAITNDTQIH